MPYTGSIPVEPPLIRQFVSSVALIHRCDLVQCSNDRGWLVPVHLEALLALCPPQRAGRRKENTHHCGSLTI